MPLNTFAFIFSITTVLAAVLPTSDIIPRAPTQAVDILLKIAPKSGSCDGADFPDECATNVQAAPFLIQAMIDYKITSAYEIAAVISVAAFESGDFRYNKNHFPSPGRPGQGTRAMFMPNYVFLYAKSIPALATPLAAITPASSTDGLNDDQLNAIRELVLPDEYTWGSAAWFLTTQCDGVRAALSTGTQAGFEGYMTCLGVTATSERLEGWQTAKEAFGLS